MLEYLSWYRSTRPTHPEMEYILSKAIQKLPPNLQAIIVNDEYLENAQVLQEYRSGSFIGNAMNALYVAVIAHKSVDGFTNSGHEVSSLKSKFIEFKFKKRTTFQSAFEYVVEECMDHIAED